MANPQYVRSHQIDRAQAAEIDAGLRAHFTKVYALMGGAMLITALVAYVVGMDFKALVNQQPTALIPESVLVAMFSSPIRYVIMFAPLAVVFFFSFRLHKMSASTANIVFWGFAALMGLSIAWIFAVFTGVSIAQTFVATAIGFGAMSLYGYTTEKDLSGWGRFLFMGVIGLLVCSVINIFIESSALQFAISAVGVLIFAGLTAYDTQNIKTTYLQMRLSPEGQEWLDHAAISGALSLYINFLNMFMFLLQFMGSQE